QLITELNSLVQGQGEGMPHSGQGLVDLQGTSLRSEWHSVVRTRNGEENGQLMTFTNSEMLNGVPPISVFLVEQTHRPPFGSQMLIDRRTRTHVFIERIEEEARGRGIRSRERCRNDEEREELLLLLLP